jgi:hypothetical protein
MAKLVLVTITKPYFRVINPQCLIEDDYSFLPLEDDPDFELAGTYQKNSYFGQKVLMNGKTAHRDHRADSSTG